MKNSISPRLFQLARIFLLSAVLIISILVYLVENYSGAEAEAEIKGAVEVAIEPTETMADTDTTKSIVNIKALHTTPNIQENQVEEAAPIILITQTNPAYGLNRISNSEQPFVPESQYQNGLSTGATWDRWPLYWNKIEFPAPGVFNWGYQDVAVKGVIAHGLKLNAILLGTPGFYHTPATAQSGQSAPDTATYSPMTINETQTGVPLGLYEPVFMDGEEPGTDKVINSNNKWAQFVETAVNRYKPGGIIAQEENWADGTGVTHWEMWNEPDLLHFWDGSWDDYARLLKVGYLAAKHADPNAQVIFGGLANVYQGIPLLSHVFDNYDDDPMAASNNYFHDIIAVHNYSYAKRSWDAIFIAQRRLDARNLMNNEVWLNESGVPVRDDYPGPVCDPTSLYRATMLEQADFIIQSALYARVNGADNIFFFSLYDECGNVGGNPPFFPPDQCASNPPAPHYAGDAFGLFRNPSDSQSSCSTQHPQPGTPRPSLAAHQILTDYFVNVNWFNRNIFGQSGSGNGLHELISFYQPHTQSRVLGMWAITNEPATAVFNSTNSSQTGLLITPNGATQTITATNGIFTLPLPGATNNNTPTGTVFHSIGGRPFLLIEQDDIPPDVTITAPLTATMKVTLEWAGIDFGSNIASYDLAVSENGGSTTTILTDTTAVAANYFMYNEDSTYTFTIYGKDNAGNVSAGTSTSVYSAILDNHVYLPTIQKP